MKDFILVGLGGFIGSMLRYGITLSTVSVVETKPYISTLVVNLLGSFLIGMLVAVLSKHQNQLSLFLVVGFCGGFTTFSTFSNDGIKLLRSQLYLEYFGYTSVSILGGLGLCIFGYFLFSKP